MAVLLYNVSFVQLLLPTVLGNSNNRDLNNIDCETLADLMTGKFKDQVSKKQPVIIGLDLQF